MSENKLVRVKKFWKSQGKINKQKPGWGWLVKQNFQATFHFVDLKGSVPSCLHGLVVMVVICRNFVPKIIWKSGGKVPTLHHTNDSALWHLVLWAKIKFQGMLNKHNNTNAWTTWVSRFLVFFFFFLFVCLFSSDNHELVLIRVGNAYIVAVSVQQVQAEDLERARHHSDHHGVQVRTPDWSLPRTPRPTHWLDQSHGDYQSTSLLSFLFLDDVSSSCLRCFWCRYILKDV